MPAHRQYYLPLVESFYFQLRRLTSEKKKENEATGRGLQKVNLETDLILLTVEKLKQTHGLDYRTMTTRPTKC